MKIGHVILSIVLTCALSQPMIGQDLQIDKMKTDMKPHDLSMMMGKALVDTTYEGLHMKAWIMTQKQHMEMRNMRMSQMTMHREGAGTMERLRMNDSTIRMSKEKMPMKQDGMGMNKAMMDSMSSGTHHIVLDITNATTGKQLDSASVRILIVSPSKKSSSVVLKPMMSHFGGALVLDEKGEYQFAVNVEAGGVVKTTQFLYAVK